MMAPKIESTKHWPAAGQHCSSSQNVPRPAETTGLMRNPGMAGDEEKSKRLKMVEVEVTDDGVTAQCQGTSCDALRDE